MDSMHEVGSLLRACLGSSDNIPVSRWFKASKPSLPPDEISGRCLDFSRQKSPVHTSPELTAKRACRVGGLTRALVVQE